MTSSVYSVSVIRRLIIHPVGGNRQDMLPGDASVGGLTLLVFMRTCLSMPLAA